MEGFVYWSNRELYEFRRFITCNPESFRRGNSRYILWSDRTDLDGAIHSLPTRFDAVGIADKFPTRWNNAKEAPTGDLWLVTMTYKADASEGTLYRLTKDGKTLQRILSGVTISKGTGWSSDGSIFYYIDSPTLAIDAFEFHGSSSEIHRIHQTP